MTTFLASLLLTLLLLTHAPPTTIAIRDASLPSSHTVSSIVQPTAIVSSEQRKTTASSETVALPLLPFYPILTFPSPISNDQPDKTSMNSLVKVIGNHLGLYFSKQFDHFRNVKLILSTADTGNPMAVTYGGGRRLNDEDDEEEDVSVYYFLDGDVLFDGSITASEVNQIHLIQREAFQKGGLIRLLLNIQATKDEVLRTTTSVSISYGDPAGKNGGSESSLEEDVDARSSSSEQPIQNNKDGGWMIVLIAIIVGLFIATVVGIVCLLFVLKPSPSVPVEEITKTRSTCSSRSSDSSKDLEENGAGESQYSGENSYSYSLEGRSVKHSIDTGSSSFTGSSLLLKERSIPYGIEGIGAGSNMGNDKAVMAAAMGDMDGEESSAWSFSKVGMAMADMHRETNTVNSNRNTTTASANASSSRYPSGRSIETYNNDRRHADDDSALWTFSDVGEYAHQAEQERKSLEMMTTHPKRNDTNRVVVGNNIQTPKKKVRQEKRHSFQSDNTSVKPTIPMERVPSFLFERVSCLLFGKRKSEIEAGPNPNRMPTREEDCRHGHVQQEVDDYSLSTADNSRCILMPVPPPSNGKKQQGRYSKESTIDKHHATSPSQTTTHDTKDLCLTSNNNKSAFEPVFISSPKTVMISSFHNTTATTTQQTSFTTRDFDLSFPSSLSEYIPGNDDLERYYENDQISVVEMPFDEF